MTELTEAERRRQQDFEDLQHEMSGVDVGRMRRFLSADDERSPEGRRKKRELRRYRQTLDQLMRDPEYARLHIALGRRLSEAETETENALASIQEALGQMRTNIERMEEDAARDPQGRPVFRYADGRVVYADGSSVEASVAEGIIWPDNAPSAESYFAARSHERALEDNLTEWTAYQNDVLGDIRNRIDDQDNPFQSVDSLKSALDRIENSRPRIFDAKPDNTVERSAADIAPSSFPTIPQAL